LHLAAAFYLLLHTLRATGQDRESDSVVTPTMTDRLKVESALQDTALSLC